MSIQSLTVRGVWADITTDKYFPESTYSVAIYTTP